MLGEMGFKAYHTPVFPECCLPQILGLPCALEEAAHPKNILRGPQEPNESPLPTVMPSSVREQQLLHAHTCARLPLWQPWATRLLDGGAQQSKPMDTSRSSSVHSRCCASSMAL